MRARGKRHGQQRGHDAGAVEERGDPTQYLRAIVDEAIESWRKGAIEAERQTVGRFHGGTV